MPFTIFLKLNELFSLSLSLSLYIYIYIYICHHQYKTAAHINNLLGSCGLNCVLLICICHVKF
jgi:hypothetical protein